MAKYAYHRVDVNAAAIYHVLQRCGASVYRGGPLDAIVGFKGRNYLVEVKTATGKLRASQQAFLARWQGQAVVVRSVDDALAAIGASRGGGGCVT